jgi:AcrR family transcriptional regulator
MKKRDASSRPGDAASPREQLLQAAVEYATQEGLADVSLRQLAGRLGVSHRMLIYHFGSKEQMLTAVVAEVERRQREAFAGLQMDAATSPGEIARKMWRRLADPQLWPLERLFFELYGQALQGRPHTEGFLQSAMTPWLEMLTEVHQIWGLPPAKARATARMGLAATRGLLLDLLATGDRRGVDEAMRLFIEMYETLLERTPMARTTKNAVRRRSVRSGDR